MMSSSAAPGTTTTPSTSPTTQSPTDTGVPATVASRPTVPRLDLWPPGAPRFSRTPEVQSFQAATSRTPHRSPIRPGLGHCTGGQNLAQYHGRARHPRPPPARSRRGPGHGHVDARLSPGVHVTGYAGAAREARARPAHPGRHGQGPRLTRVAARVRSVPRLLRWGPCQALAPLGRMATVTSISTAPPWGARYADG